MKEFMSSGYLHIALCIVSSVILIVGFFAWAFYLIKYVTRPKESTISLSLKLPTSKISQSP